MKTGCFRMTFLYCAHRVKIRALWMALNLYMRTHIENGRKPWRCTIISMVVVLFCNKTPHIGTLKISKGWSLDTTVYQFFILLPIPARYCIPVQAKVVVASSHSSAFLAARAFDVIFKPSQHSPFRFTRQPRLKTHHAHQRLNTPVHAYPSYHVWTRDLCGTVGCESASL